MASKSDNTLLTRLFPDDSGENIREKYGFTRKTRYKRLHEIISLLRKHEVTKGLSPDQFCDLLVDLGPSFIKLGQMLSLRSEILPQSYCEALARLQAQCDPMPFNQVQEVLQDIYGERFSQIFKEIDPVPLGSASLAQVHKAVLVTGETVAVKVRRPDVRVTMAQDIDVLRSIAKRLDRFMAEGQMVDLRQVVEELSDTVEEETDFLKEAANLFEFAQLNADVKFIDCPKPFMEYCTDSVLVMEYVQGIPIDDSRALKAAGYDLEEIGQKALDNYAAQILDHGFFHADPHPGNIIIREGKIVYLDLGMMGRLSARDRQCFQKIIEAVGQKNGSKLKDALISYSVDADLRRIDHTRLVAELDAVLDRYGSVDVADIDVGALLMDIVALTRQCKVTLPSSVTQVARGIVTMEGTLAEYIANCNIITIINDHIMRDRDVAKDAEHLAKELMVSLYAATKGLSNAAEYSGEVLRMMSRGQMKMNMELMGSVEPLKRLSRIINRFTMSLVVAGLLVGASLIFSVQGLPQFMGMPVLSFIMYLCALVIFIVILVDIYRKS
ncbi:MAG: ABC1 kinase family protein [Eggerthellaceae bacterium]